MKYDQSAWLEACRAAWDELSDPQNPDFTVPVEGISLPAVLRQEKALTNSSSTYKFEFGANAVKPDATLNNILLGRNNVFSQIALRIRLGYGASANTRVYQSFGSTSIDDVLYRGQLSQRFEKDVDVENMDLNMFREEGDYGQFSGLVLTNPVRNYSGLMARNEITLELPNVTGLALTANLYISVEIVGGLGQTGSQE